MVEDLGLIQNINGKGQKVVGEAHKTSEIH
jgi:hypothetical protein